MGDAVENAIRVGQYVVVPEAEDAKTTGLKETGALGIVIGRFGVLTAVQLNDELCAVAGEIREVRAQWNLFAPVVVREAGAQRTPEHALGVGHVAAKAAGTFNRAWCKREPSKALPLVGRVGWGRVLIGFWRGGRHKRGLFGRRRGRPPTNLPHKGGGFGLLSY